MPKITLLFIIFLFSAISNSSADSKPDPVALKLKADSNLVQSRYDSAVVNYGKAAAAFLEISEIRQYIYCKNQEAYTLGLLNKSPEALAICERIIEEFPDSLRACEYDVYFYWKLALFNRRLENFKKAYTYGITTMEIAESYSIFEGYMKNDVLEILTISARYTGLYDIALGHAFERMRYNISINDYKNLSHAYNNIALIYKRFHDNRRAMEYFSKCIELREKYAPAWVPYVTVNVGEMFLRSDKIDSAYVWFERTLNILQDQGVKENLLYSSIYSSIAEIFARQDNFESALEYIDRSLEIRLRYYRIDDKHTAYYLQTKADILILYGDLKSASEILQKLEYLYIDETNSPQVISEYYQSMAKYFKVGNDNTAAISEHQKSIIVLTKDFDDTDIYSLPGKDDFFYGKERLLSVIIEKSMILSDLYDETGDPQYLSSVIDHYNFALELINLMIDDQSSMESVSNLFKDFAQLYETAIQASISLNKLNPGGDFYKNISSYMEASRMNHAKILYRLNQVINLGGIPDSLIQRKTELEGMIASRKSKTGEETENSREKFNIEQELDRISLLLKNNYTRFASGKAIDFDMLENSQKNLDSKGMILQYYFGKENLYLLATTKNSNSFYKLKWGTRETHDLNNFIRNIRVPASHKGLEELNSRVFHSLGLDSVLTEGLHEIVIIPDRELYFIPFDAIMDKDNNYLIYKYSIHNENSLFFMNIKGRRLKDAIPLLAMAPFAEPGKESAKLQPVKRIGEIDLLPLPGSKREVETIHNLMGGIVIAGASATENFFRENAKNTEIIHLSSHSFLDDENPLYNSIVLAPGDDDDDGSLYTHELYGLSLGSDLVTLSACNTGIGRYLDGEGMVSLATGFRSAGVQNIIMSLWSLPDDATSIIMIDFYKHLKGGKNIADALRQAKLDYLGSADQNSSVPYFWAASVLTGSNSTVGRNSKPALMVAVLVTVFLLLVFQYWYRRRKKHQLNSRNVT